jgi:predicted PurR-regulated permease PerM
MEDPARGVWFLVFVVVLHQLEGNLIYPKVVGESIGLPALWVLLAILLGGGVAGVLGMVWAFGNGRRLPPD